MWAEVTLHKLFKVEDWYKDGKTRVETIRKGKGRKPYVDSTVYCKCYYFSSKYLIFCLFLVYLRIQLDEEELYSNFPKELSEMKGQDELNFLQTFNDFKEMTTEQREASLDNPALIKQKMDSYEMPSTLTKLVKSIQKNQVVRLTTMDLAKLRTNFASSYFD